MAKIKVKLFGVFRMDTHLSEENIEANKISDIFDIINKKAKTDFAQKKLSSPSLSEPDDISFRDAIVYVNGERCPRKNKKLADGDEIWLLSPASGG